MTVTSPEALILFDLDGTLIDTTELILASFEFTLARHLPGYQPTREQLIATFGLSLPKTLRDMAREAAVPDPEAVGDAMLVTYREFQRERHDGLVQPIEGVTEMLDALAAAGRVMGVVTSKMEPYARHGMRLYDLERYFGVGVFHDDTDRHKPDPAPLLLAASRAGVDPANAVYVGDSIHDVAAGRAAGMRTIAALWGPFDPQMLCAAGPDAVAPTPRDLLRLLSSDEG